MSAAVDSVDNEIMAIKCLVGEPARNDSSGHRYKILTQIIFAAEHDVRVRVEGIEVGRLQPSLAEFRDLPPFVA